MQFFVGVCLMACADPNMFSTVTPVNGQDLTLIPTGVTIYGSHCFKAKFLKKLLSNINLKKIANP